MKRYAIIGAGGCGRGVMPLVRQQLKLDVTSGEDDLVFLDDLPQAPFLNGHRVISYAKWGVSSLPTAKSYGAYVGVQRPWQKLRGYVWATAPARI